MYSWGLWRQSAWNVKSCLLRKISKYVICWQFYTVLTFKYFIIDCTAAVDQIRLHISMLIWLNTSIMWKDLFLFAETSNFSWCATSRGHGKADLSNQVTIVLVVTPLAQFFLQTGSSCHSERNSRTKSCKKVGLYTSKMWCDFLFLFYQQNNLHI